MVSRLRKPAEVREALARFADGRVDILIGTHRLLSRDVRAKDLGLGDRRRGAALRRQAEGAPAPAEAEGRRALALGDADPAHAADEPRRAARHLGDRDAARGPAAGAHLRRALRRGAGRARDRARGRRARARCSSSTTGSTRCTRSPSACARCARASASPRRTGRWTSPSSRRRCSRFLRGDADCLVATTIIESGLDIPQANTLIVERADQLGLAQAYQIRGRVGRSAERAFAYMLYPSEEALGADAGARLATLSDHTELGSGFAIAMRDLELRGAGDLLGDEQSGHVAAIGFELYVSLLDEAVEQLRAQRGEATARPRPPVRLDLDVDAYLPADYIPFEAAKIDVHRRIAGARAAGRAARPCATSFATASARCRSRSRTCSRCSGPGSSSAPRGRGPRRSAAGGSRSSRSSSTRRPSAAVRERIPEAMYELRTRTLSLRVGDEPGGAPGGDARPHRGARRRRSAPSRSRPERSLSRALGARRYAAEPVSPQGKKASPAAAARARRRRRPNRARRSAWSSSGSCWSRCS